MESSKKTSLKFPKRFLWGVSSSAHQVDGGSKNQWSEWEKDNALKLAKQAEYQFGDLENWPNIKSQATATKNYISGTSTNHYSNYQKDFDLIKKLNMNALRFSIEWSRIEPSEGSWDARAIDHYRQYVKELKLRGIEPVVTLFHFTLPVWFTEMGGFEKRANIKYFVRFAEKIISELGVNVRYIITINEPETYAFESYMLGNWPPNQTSKWKFWRVVNNLSLAHRQAAKAIHGLNRRYKVSVAKNSTYFYPGDDAWLTRLSARVMQYVQDDYFLHKVARHCDFIGVNYYFTNRVYGYRVHNPEQDLCDIGWDMQPRDIQYVLERLHQKYKLPLIVTENGLADAEDKSRKWWIRETLIGMQAAIDEGVRLDGYLHRSLTDNFEWDKGFWPRFGLFEVDYKTGARKPRASAVWFSKILKHIRG